MAKTLGIRKLDRPPYVSRRADDLAVDEIAYPPGPERECSRHDQDVSDAQKGLPVDPAEEQNPYYAAKQEAVSRHAAEPASRDVVWMLPVKRPFIEHDFDKSPTNENPCRNQNCQV